MNMEWISMEDRQPEEGQEVLYYFELCGVNYGKYERHLDHDDGEIYHIFSGPKGFLTNDVTHWMPLPKGPNEEAINGDDSHQGR